MELFEMVHLTGRRFVALVLCGALAAAAAVSYAQGLPRDYEAESVIFASQLFRDARTDAELYTLVDDLILATELPQVTDVIDQATGLTYESEYTLAADRAVAGGISVTLVGTAATDGDAEAVVRSASRAALSFIAGQDQGRAEAARDHAVEAMSTTLAEMERVEGDAGGVSPTVLVGQAEEQLATLINARGPLVATTPEENRLRSRLVELRPMAREYQQLEFLLEGYRNGLQTSLADVERTGSVTLALDSDIIVETRPQQASQIPLLVQAVLVAFGAVFLIGCLLFTALDRIRGRSSLDADRTAGPEEAQKPVKTEVVVEPAAVAARNGSGTSTANGVSVNGSSPKRAKSNGSAAVAPASKAATVETERQVPKTKDGSSPARTMKDAGEPPVPKRKRPAEKDKVVPRKDPKSASSKPEVKATPPTGKRPVRQLKTSASTRPSGSND